VAACVPPLEGFAHDLREMIGRGDGAATLSAVAVTRAGAAGLASGPVPGRLA
jgi:hypothetical protein